MRWLRFAALGALVPLALFALLASSVRSRATMICGPCIRPIRVSIDDRALRLPAPLPGPAIIRCGPWPIDDPREPIPNLLLASAKFAAPSLPFDSRVFVPVALRESILGAGPLLKCQSVQGVHSRPDWPERADRLGIHEGWVLVEFDLSDTGVVENARVIDAAPHAVFESSALRAVERSCYRPAIEDGRAVARRALRVRVRFETHGATS